MPTAAKATTAVEKRILLIEFVGSVRRDEICVGGMERR